jgi:hypothetical protein
LSTPELTAIFSGSVVKGAGGVVQLVATATGINGLVNGILKKVASTAATQAVEKVAVGTAVREGAAEALAQAAPAAAGAAEAAPSALAEETGAAALKKPNGVFRADADLLQPRLGPAWLSHAEDYTQVIKELEAAGVEIDYRPGSLAYAPAKGGPGRLVLDPDASIGAVRHEYQHFLDIQAAEFPGIGAYFNDLPKFARVEVRGYLREIATARQTGNADLVPQIVQQMKARVKEVLGR